MDSETVSLFLALLAVVAQLATLTAALPAVGGRFSARLAGLRDQALAAVAPSVGVAGVVLVLALAAIVSGGGSDNEANSIAEGLEQTRTVTISGTALPQLPQSGDGDPAVGQVIPERPAVRRQSRRHPQRRAGQAHPLRRPLVPPLPEGGPAARRLAEVAPAAERRRPLHGVDRGGPEAAQLPAVVVAGQGGLEGPTLADSDDGKAADAYGLSAFPYFVAVDGSGKVVARTTGEI